MNIKEMNVSQLALLWGVSSLDDANKAIIESELKARVQQNNKFSREYLYYLSNFQKRTIGVEFIPTSDAYNRYGADIAVVEILLNDAERDELAKNYSMQPPLNTSGKIKAKALVGNGILPEDVDFFTREIIEICHR